MKRKPIKRTSRLRSNKSLRSTKAPVTKKRIRYRSKKMEETYVERRVLVADILAERRVCEAHWDGGCTRRSEDVHERLPRSLGGEIVGGKPELYMAVCRYCHSMIDDNPNEARLRGLLVARRGDL